MKIITTGSAGGLFCAYKALLPAGISRCVEKVRQSHSLFYKP